MRHDFENTAYLLRVLQSSTYWQALISDRQAWFDTLGHGVEGKMGLCGIACSSSAIAERLIVRQQRLGTWGFYRCRTTSGISKEGLNI